MPPPVVGEVPTGQAPLLVSLLGPFSVASEERLAGPWERPVAKRLCALVLLSPGRRVTRLEACQALFSNLAPTEAARGLSKALSMARAALDPLGDPGRGLLRADRGHIWADPGCPLEVDCEAQQELLRSALDAKPGQARDDLFALALANQGALLEDEPAAEWAHQLRERLEWARQEARLTLARDRTRGFGHCRPTDVVDAWEACLAHDATCEEGACALMRVYQAQGKQALVGETYRRCRSALEQLGLRISPALDEVYGEGLPAERGPGTPKEASSPPAGAPYAEERRPVSVLFAELSGTAGFNRADPEDLRDAVRQAVVGLITEVERLGGTVTSVSGAGLQALFGAPASHEDDPERAVRAAYRMLSSLASQSLLSLRVGVETGPAVVGPIAKSARADYGAVGEVVGAAASLQSVARPSSVLVGPATRSGTEGLFEWGPSEDVIISAGMKPFVASYLERPRARPVGQAGRRGLASSAPLVGRKREISFLRETLQEMTAGKGGLVVIAGEPGLGKTRLVQECRKLFMAWVGSASGRLPLWLEGRSASYASTSPYGLYQQLLAAWVGVAPDETADRVRAAFERAIKAVFAGGATQEQTGLLSQLMGLGPGTAERSLSRLSPEQLQRASFSAVEAVITRLRSFGPTVLVLEDLHWSDPTSLHLTAEIAALTKDGPLLLLLTRRPEPDPGVSALEETLASSSGITFRRLELAPLGPEPTRALVLALLGRGAEDEVVSAVTHSTEGNPLFVEERLSSLLETGALKRAEAGWQLASSPSGGVPEALERLVRARVDRLDPGPHEALVAASVLGPEFGVGALSTVTDLNGQLAGAVSALCSGGLLVALRQSPEPVYRFRHAFIQEATYAGLLREQRRQLHARAAWGLEELSSGRLEEAAGVLGHHFALAGENGRAAHYLELAGDRASAAFANDEAVTSYRRALELLSEASAVEAPGAEDRARITGLRAKLAEVLLRSSRYSEARQVLLEGLAAVGADDPFSTARLHALHGRLETSDHNYEAALAAFEAASNLLGEDPAGLDQMCLDLWLEIQVDGRVYLYYWLNQPEKAVAILDLVGPVIEARGAPRRQQSFYWMVAMQRARATRYRIDDQMLSDLVKALAIAREHLSEPDIATMLFVLGFALLWHGDLDEAKERLEESMELTERTGDVILRARCLCYLDVAALRRHDPGTIRTLAPQAIEAAEAANYPEYVASARAAQAWVAWQDGRERDVLALAGQALELWATTVVSYSWYWICLWPLIAVRLAHGQTGEAVGAARQLLPPPQQRLPDELESLTESAIAAWEGKEPDKAATLLGEAVEEARRLRYA